MVVCLFDIDGTLLSSGGAGKAAMEAALATAFGVPASADGIPFSGRTDRAIGRDLFHHHGVEPSEDNWRRFVASGWHSLEDLAAAKPDLLFENLLDPGPLLDLM